MSDLCKNGHNLHDDNNIRYDKRGVRICRQCDVLYQKEHRGELKCLPPDTPAVTKGYKEPLRTVEGGYGYYGAITYDESYTYTQCHICGWFYKFLGKHIVNAHETTSDDYKYKFGLEKKNSLLATNTRSVAVERWASLSQEQKQTELQRLREAAKKASAQRHGVPDGPRRLEWHNERGSCPDQIIDKILVLLKKSGVVPTQREFTKEYGRRFLNAASVHFGSWAEAVKQAGLTPRERHKGQRWYTDEQLLESIRAFQRTHNREPYCGDLGTGLLLASPSVYRERFGSWSKAKELSVEKVK